MIQTKKQQAARAKIIQQVLKQYIVGPTRTRRLTTKDPRAMLWAHTDIYNRTGILILHTVAAFFDNNNDDRPTITARPVKNVQEAEELRDRTERVCKNTLLHIQTSLNRAIKPKNVRRRNGVRASSMAGTSVPPELWVPVKLIDVGIHYRVEFPPEFTDLPSADFGSIKASDRVVDLEFMDFIKAMLPQKHLLFFCRTRVPHYSITHRVKSAKSPVGYRLKSTWSYEKPSDDCEWHGLGPLSYDTIAVFDGESLVAMTMTTLLD